MQEHGVFYEPSKRPVARVPGYTRGKTGCLTCRQTKKRCDGSDGRCDQCRRLKLRCLWELERDIVAAARTAPLSGPGSQIVLFKAPNPTQFGLEVSDETANGWNRRQALRYYIQAFAAILSTKIESNGFLTGMCVSRCWLSVTSPFTIAMAWPHDR